MKVFHSISDFNHWRSGISSESVGLVPTMGYLHAGHEKLVRKSLESNDVTVVSVFVNPTQFNDQEDFIKYPRNIDKDIKLLDSIGCDIVLIPKVEEMYQTDTFLKFNFGYLEEIMEGAFRPGHYSGVATIVSKFFHVVKPDKAYFGLKDLQQVRVIELLVRELMFDLEIVPVQTRRENSGLAMSSRNSRLSNEELKMATNISFAIERMKESCVNNGSSIDINILTKEGRDFLESSGLRVEYLEIVNFATLKNVSVLEGNCDLAICVAVYLGDVRLIDNLIIRKEEFGK